MRGSRSSDALVQARREQILELVLDQGSVEIRELAGRHGVSQMTVHRDLEALAGAGFLHKQRGRAVAPSALRVQTSALFRMRSSGRVKAALAAAAADRLGDVRSLMVDDSTSVLPLLRALGEQRGDEVTLVTNYVEAARQASHHARFTVHLLGGRYVPELDATFGPVTTRQASSWRVDATVVSVPAVADGRCYHPLQDSAALKKAAIGAAARSVLLLDHSKLGRRSAHDMFPASVFDTVVVDDAADVQQLDRLRSDGTEVVTVPARPNEELP